MNSHEPIKFKGAPGSPYTRKMLAYLRYRGIRYEILIGDHAKSLGMPDAKVGLLPTFYLPGDDGQIEAVVDSTPLIRRLEQEFSGKEALPSHPVLGFLNYLIEDFADEWLTKSMFHYRWYYDDDIDMAGTILPMWTGIQASSDQLKDMKHYVANRQISRLYVVGSNDLTAPVIEASYVRFLSILDRLIEKQLFVLGSRPSSADFAIYAQLTQLAKFDPTPAKICLERAPRVLAWTDLVDDLSGNPGSEDGWLSEEDLKQSLRELLEEIGKVYVPALLANAKAIESGDEEMSLEIDGKPWRQPVFPYQAKCLQWIREEYEKLGSNAQGQVNAIIDGSGCEDLLR